MIEVNKNLFDIKDTYYAHCISRDYALGKGIAKQFDYKYNMREKLILKKDNSKCVLINNVFNLITKDKYYLKPTYESLEESLLQLKDKILELGVKRLTIPKLGCGLDKLEWNRVKPMIEDIFKDVNLEIIVCYI